MNVRAFSGNVFVRRAYDGFGLGPLAIVTAFTICLSLTAHFSWASIPYRDGWFGKWLALEFASFFLVGLVGALILFPTLNFAPRQGIARAAVLVMMIFVTAVVLAWLRIASLFQIPMYYPPEHHLDRYIPRLVLQFSSFGAIVVMAAELFRRETADLEAAHRADLDRSTLEGELLAVRLQVLRAQVEPHFLFNSLATVRRLYDTDPSAGREMLLNLMRYLEIALPHMKAEMSRLQDELAIARAFLNVQKVRMGERLTFSIDFPLELAAVALPSMMVLTVVENAIKHGLTPLRHGGAVHVEARRARDRLVVTVADTGCGFGGSASQGTGTGIANLRARLFAKYGTAATVAFSSAAPQGAIVTLSVPIVEPLDAHP